MSKKRPVDELGSLRPRGHGSKFSRKMEAAVAALLSERNVEEAARVAGIGTQTLRRWMKDPEFQAAYLEARRAAVAQSNARLQQYSSAAVSTLFKVMLNPDSPASTRVRAADSVLDHAKRSIDQEDIEVRVAALERAAQTGEATWRQLKEVNEKYPAAPL
ncbi:MAG: transposase family protein [Bryobacteraceae bacterium]